jgi:phosphotriesterase-related protein
MATVQTVLGPVDAASLGFVLSHEHVITGQQVQHYPWAYDVEAQERRAIDELSEAKRGGVDSVIELTTPDLGRDVERMVKVARASGVHIVAATGTWRAIPHYLWGADLDFIASLYVHEIEVGIGHTPVRAGVIKVANDTEGITPSGERVLRGAARACVRTGCPISTHHYAPMELGREQVRIFREEGVQLDRVCIGHSADTTDVDYLEDLLDEGVYLSMDRYPGSGDRPNWEQRNATVKALVDRGWAHRLMLGHDHGPGQVRRDAPPPPRTEPTRYLFLTRTAIPALLASGVSPDAVDLMTREVPRRFLTGEA